MVGSIAVGVLKIVEGLTEVKGAILGAGFLLIIG
jgi:hypothetical protein